MLTNDNGKRIAIIHQQKMYTLTELHDEDMAELFNGGVLPIVPEAMRVRDRILPQPTAAARLAQPMPGIGGAQGMGKEGAGGGKA